MPASMHLRPGERGDAVRDLQRRLAGAGHDPSGDEPGAYGPATEHAVRAFQRRRGLREDGLCGEQTWTSLVEAGHRLGERLLYLRSPMLRGDDVAELQQLLGGLGFDAGRVDAIFGPDTANALTEFQRNAGLTTDGICGPDTIATLRRFTAGTVGAATGSTVASLREAEMLRAAGPGLRGRRFVIGEHGDVSAVADAIERELQHAGAVVSVVRNPDDHALAATANAFDAHAFVGLVVRDDPIVACSFYAHEGFASVGGRRLAGLLTEELASAGLGAGTAAGMRLPVLRETRMPAVVVELGPPAAVVLGTHGIAAAVAGAMRRWTAEPT